MRKLSAIVSSKEIGGCDRHAVVGTGEEFGDLLDLTSLITSAAVFCYRSSAFWENRGTNYSNIVIM
jgi:hypothetical protein